MPTEVAEPPVVEQPPVSESKPLTMKPGDKYREAFEKIQKTIPPKEEAAVAEPPVQEPPSKPEEPPTKEPEPPSKPEETPSKPPDAAQSPLDVVTADVKEEPVKEPEPDVLKEFEDEKTANWRKAREVMKRQSEEKKALEVELAKLKEAPKAAPEEIAKLTEEREKLKQSLSEREELIKTVDVRLSEDYRALAKKRDDTMGKIATRAKSYGVDADSLVSALLLPDSKFKTDQIKATMAELEPDDRARINVLIEQLDGHNDAIFEFEQDAPKKFEEIQAKREQAYREQEAATIKVVEDEYAKLIDTLPKDIVTLRKVPDDVPGAEEWNAEITKAQEDGLRVLKPGGADLKESQETALLGKHYPFLLKRFLKEHSENRDMRKRLAEFDSSGPDFKGGSKPTTEAKLTPGEKYQKALQSLQSANDT